MDEDTYKRVGVLEKFMSLENPRQEISFWITTLKGNRKYLESAMEIIEENGEIVQILNLLRDVTKEKLEADEFERLNLSLKDAQHAASIINFHGDEKFYYWPPEVYQLIEREPREDDKYNTIILNLVSNETRREFEKLISELIPENPTIEN